MGRQEVLHHAHGSFDAGAETPRPRDEKLSVSLGLHVPTTFCPQTVIVAPGLNQEKQETPERHRRQAAESGRHPGVGQIRPCANEIIYYILCY
jgi:hypothetical protein